MRMCELAAAFRMIWRPKETRRGEGFYQLMSAIDGVKEEAETTTSELRAVRVTELEGQDPAHEAVISIVERFNG